MITTLIIIDFEKAEENAFRKCILDATIHGCFFHFTQSNLRKIKELGMQKRNWNDQEFNLMLKTFNALAFCKLEDVSAWYNILVHQFFEKCGNEKKHQDL